MPRRQRRSPRSGTWPAHQRALRSSHPNDEDAPAARWIVGLIALLGVSGSASPPTMAAPLPNMLTRGARKSTSRRPWKNQRASSPADVERVRESTVSWREVGPQEAGYGGTRLGDRPTACIFSKRPAYRDSGWRTSVLAEMQVTIPTGARAYDSVHSVPIKRAEGLRAGDGQAEGHGAATPISRGPKSEHGCPKRQPHATVNANNFQEEQQQGSWTKWFSQRQREARHKDAAC